MSTQESSQDTGFQPDLVEGVRCARDHRVAALNFYTMLVVYYTQFDRISEEEFQVEHGEDMSIVRWEGGPYKWALDVMGGQVIGSTEFQSHNESDIFPDILQDCGAYVEVKNDYTLAFHSE